MNLMLLARLRAAWHIRFGFAFNRPRCRIWRFYSAFGFRMHAVFCDCGKVFSADEKGRALLRAYAVPLRESALNKAGG